MKCKVQAVAAVIICGVLAASTAYAQVSMAPDGTYVYGQPTMAPDGTYVGKPRHDGYENRRPSYQDSQPTYRELPGRGLLGGSVNRGRNLGEGGFFGGAGGE